MAKVKLDKTDRQILKILQENGKMTNLDLSRMVGLSPAPTLERVRKLEKNDIIKSYHAEINPNSLGLNIQTYILVALAWHKDNAINNFLDQIGSIEEVIECYHVTGTYDFLLKTITKDIASYEELLLKKVTPLKEIERIQTLMVLSPFKESKVLPFDYEEGNNIKQ